LFSGNLGGGVTQFLMPVIYQGFVSATEGRIFAAWRWAYLIPGLLHTLVGFMIMIFGQDLPDGNYDTLHESGAFEKKDPVISNFIGVMNYRTWCLTATYGFCFGVELTMNNIFAGYLYDQFDLDIVSAGFIASCYGMMNLFARSLGGIASDKMSVRFGMRGRLWSLWLIQTLEGFL
jgi:NNP family nitrate/nitrite transporter-like MFS transporter